MFARGSTNGTLCGFDPQYQPDTVTIELATDYREDSALEGIAES